jgi:hypothetical protein
MDARIDICDNYAFQKPGDSNKSIFVLDINPMAPTYADSFAPETTYELKVDTDGNATTVADAGEYSFYTGIRSDPFFFDLDGMKNDMKFTTGFDAFLDKNVFSIVLEMPDKTLGNNPKVGIWNRGSNSQRRKSIFPN